MRLDIEDLRASYLKNVEEYLLRDKLLNIYTLGDLELPDSRAKFRIASSGNKILGLMLTYEFDDYPIIWLHAAGEAADQLLDEINYGKFVMIAETSSLRYVIARFEGANAFKESVMLLKRENFKSRPDANVRKAHLEDVMAWAKSLSDGEEPDIMLMRKAEDRLKRNDCFGYFAGQNIVSRGVVDMKSKYGWAIGGIYTLPRYRNKGLATSVMSGIINAAPPHVTDFILYVREDNSPAIRSYTKTGFRVIGERLFVDYNAGIIP